MNGDFKGVKIEDTSKSLLNEGLILEQEIASKNKIYWKFKNGSRTKLNLISSSLLLETQISFRNRFGFK